MCTLFIVLVDGFPYYDMHIMRIGETSSTVEVDGLTGAQPKILSRVGKLPKSARDHSPCIFLKPFYRLTKDFVSL